MTTAQDGGDKDKGAEKARTFTETALRLGGKSEEEAVRTGAVDLADEQVEAMFAERFKTNASPVHKAVWEDSAPLALFSSPPLDRDASCLPVMERCLELVRKHKTGKTLFDQESKVSAQVLQELAGQGYWGMLIDPKYGGHGASLQHFMSFLTRMATIDPTCAGLASVHGCIGAVDPVRTFGSEEQKAKFLPRLASGEALSAFALTEPNAGSDLTALRTAARLDGDHYVINGEKLFITNAIPGRTIVVVCMIEGKPAALITELPEQVNENFQLANYKLYALKHCHNNGLIFKDFKVPAENRLQPAAGDGLTVAYHGLNLGRLALCASASGVMRVMLANILPWAHFRETYGRSIDTRELVKRRIASTAGLIVAADALVEWGSSLLDQGYRGELECIIAKIFGSEAQKETAIEYFMKTHGGRSFVHGHTLGDNLHEFLAPCIYEGEGEMLGMAFFKALAKEHGTRFFEPVGKALQREGLTSLNPSNPAHVWKLRNELVPYASWYLKKLLSGPDVQEVAGMAPVLKQHLDFALSSLKEAPLELSEAMTKHQLKLADRQCRIAYLSQRIQDMITILVTALYAHRQKDEVITAAAGLLCEDLKRKLSGEQPSDSYFRRISTLADMVIAGGFKPIQGICCEDILFSYEKI